MPINHHHFNLLTETPSNGDVSLSRDLTGAIIGGMSLITIIRSIINKCMFVINLCT